jgi:hypothetical protein
MDLYIIGNGFDLHHNIKSSYSDFKTYLLTTNHPLHELIEKYIPSDRYWSDLEQALAWVDVDTIIDDAEQFLMPYSAEEWSDAYHHDYQYQVNEIIQGLSSELLNAFTKWIKQIHIPNKTNVVTPLINIPRSSKYLTFNYTSTLSSVYDVPDKNIVHIHGNAQSNDDLILGHAWCPSEKESLNKNIDPESIDVRVMEGNEIIDEYFGNTFKDTESIINANRSFFNNLKDTVNIYVFGHSMANVDIEYFYEIIKNINLDKVIWNISYYDTNELIRHRNTTNKLGINEDNLIFRKLSDFEIST